MMLYNQFRQVMPISTRYQIKILFPNRHEIDNKIQIRNDNRNTHTTLAATEVEKPKFIATMTNERDSPTRQKRLTKQPSYKHEKQK